MISDVVENFEPVRIVPTPATKSQISHDSYIAIDDSNHLNIFLLARCLYASLFTIYREKGLNQL